MAVLSSNWKALQSKIAPKKTASGKRSTITKKKKAKKVEKVLDNPTTSTSSGTLKVSSNAIKKAAGSSIESVLWNKESDITVSDIPVGPPLSLEPIGRDTRKQEPGKYIAMDCEFVGVGFEGKESALARVSIVNFYGHVLLDTFVKPKEKVVDWRTWVSGVTPKHMNSAITFEEAQTRSNDILKDRVLVGHAIHHDLDALFLSHPKYMIRDTSTFQPFKQIAAGRTPSLKKLSLHFLKIDIQGAEHSSVEDARATMLLFRLYRKQFEQSMRQGRFSNQKNQ
ncbi:RNA exonuclease 4 [[Candida] railenensis]|uniref:RNA exonuclease 4 n=1 Tax=[Candida] railenensis TaxID=45579 RepID=A0A9P0QP89_9ASCO|nr:RNA exonuclease 4 [[Candida] railenensis]